MVDKERREITAESVMARLMECKTEMGQQVELLRVEITDLRGEISSNRVELKEHQSIVSDMLADWNKFLKDFEEMLLIFRSAKGFFRVLGWIGTAAKWIMIIGAVLGAVLVFAKTGHWPGVGK